MTTRIQKTSPRRSSPHKLSDPAVERFAQALRQAMAINGFSERRLGTELGITIGTTQKYFRGAVNPMNVSTRINKGLAEQLGVTLDQLVHFYETGEFDSVLTFEQVVAWIRSRAGHEHVAPIVCSLSEAASRAKEGRALPAACEPEPARPEPYTWPEQELADVGLSDALRERMGLGGGGDASLARGRRVRRRPGGGVQRRGQPGGGRGAGGFQEPQAGGGVIARAGARWRRVLLFLAGLRRPSIGVERRSGVLV